MATMLPRTLLALCLLLSACEEKKIPPVIYERLRPELETSSLSGERLEKYRSLCEEGYAQRAKLNFIEALPAFQQALALCDKVGDAQRWSNAASGVAETFLSLKQYDKSEALYREIIAQNEKQFGKDSPEGADAIQGLVHVLGWKGDPPEMETLLRRLIPIREEIFYKKRSLEAFTASGRTPLMDNMLVLGILLKNSKRLKEAELNYRKAFQIEIDYQVKTKITDQMLDTYKMFYRSTLVELGDTEEQAQEKIDKMMEPISKK